jgi:hypothetical protein
LDFGGGTDIKLGWSHDLHSVIQQDFTVEERGVSLRKKEKDRQRTSTNSITLAKVQISDGTPGTLILHATPAPALMA